MRTLTLNPKRHAHIWILTRLEGLDLDARRANPTGEGIHNKMVLARIGGQGWVVAGRLNESEVSTKMNRKVTMIVASGTVYAYLGEVCWYDYGQRAVHARASDTSSGKSR